MWCTHLSSKAVTLLQNQITAKFTKNPLHYTRIEGEDFSFGDRQFKVPIKNLATMYPSTENVQRLINLAFSTFSVDFKKIPNSVLVMQIAPGRKRRLEDPACVYWHSAVMRYSLSMPVQSYMAILMTCTWKEWFCTWDNHLELFKVQLLLPYLSYITAGSDQSVLDGGDIFQSKVGFKDELWTPKNKIRVYHGTFNYRITSKHN